MYSTTSGTGGTQSLAVDGHGRYVRMYGTVRATGWGYSLWEFQVFGSFDPTTTCGSTNAALNRPAVASSSESGGGQNVGWIAPGDWLAYDNVDLGATSPASVTTRIASGATVSGPIQYRLDSTTGPVIASVPVSPTGGWQSWTSAVTALSGTATGAHRVYITFTGTAGADFTNINWFQFNH